MTVLVHSMALHEAYKLGNWAHINYVCPSLSVTAVDMYHVTYANTRVHAAGYMLIYHMCCCRSRE